MCLVTHQDTPPLLSTPYTTFRYNSPAPAFEEPYIEETPEERLVRKAKQKADFEAAERLNGHTPEDLISEMQGAVAKLTLYFNYIEHRKTQWEQGLSSRLRWYDKVDAFDRFIVNQEGILYTFVMGYQLYAFKATIDLEREDLEGYTNRELMEEGKCPIGADGKVMNYHHLTRIDALTHKSSGNKDEEDRRFIMLLLPSSIHTGYSGLLHLSANFYRDLPNKSKGQGIDRAAFAHARKAFSQALVKLLDQ